MLRYIVVAGVIFMNFIIKLDSLKRKIQVFLHHC